MNKTSSEFLVVRSKVGMRLVLALFLGMLPLRAQASDDLLALLSHLGRPILLVLKSEGPGKGRSAQDLRDEPGLEDLYVTSMDRMLPKENGMDGIAKALCGQIGPGDLRWVLVGATGVLAWGRTDPDPRLLSERLAQAGYLTRSQRLQDFLRLHPDHLEAREKLLASLYTAAMHKTYRFLGSEGLRTPQPALREAMEPSSPWDILQQQPPLVLRDTLPRRDRILGPAQDQRIWGPYAQELDRVLRNGDWLLLNLGFRRWEKDSVDLVPLLEAASPLMKAIYRVHRPALLAALRETPEDQNLLDLWVRTSLVLEEPLIPVFGTLDAPRREAFRSHQTAWPGPGVIRALTAEASARNEWSWLRDLLLERWSECRLDRRLSESFTKASFPLWSDEWREIGLPALEACLRSGTPQDGDPVLDDVLQTREALQLRDEAVALARRLGRSDVAIAWAERKPRPMTPEPLWTSLTLIRSLPDSSPLDLPKHKVAARSLHPKARAHSQVPKAWRAFLGWGSGDKKWAVLDPKGRVLLQGLEPMDPKAVEAQLAGMDLPADPPEPAAAVPGGDMPWARLEAFQHETEDLMLKVKIWAEGAKRGAGTEGTVAFPVDEACLHASEEVLEKGIWQRPSFRDTLGWVATPPVAGVESLARPWMDALENALIRRPGNPSLWVRWSVWQRLLPDYSPVSLLDRLELDPLAKEDVVLTSTAWPPPSWIEAVVKRAQGPEDWSVLERVLRPGWEAEIAYLEDNKGRAHFSLGENGLALAAAYLSHGRVQEADALLEDALRLDLVRTRQEAAHHARFLRLDDLAQRWTPLRDGKMPEGVVGPSSIRP